MKRAVRVLGALFALVLLLGWLPAARAETNVAAVNEFGGCLRGQKSGDLLLLFDKSMSVATTDKPNARVKAGLYFVKQLDRFAEESAATLSVSVATFADRYDPVLPWTDLGEQGTPQALAAIEGLEKATDGVQTDYWSALNGARSELAQRKTVDQAQRCQAIVWFTDGEFSLHLRDENYVGHESAAEKVFAPGLDMRDDGEAREARDLATTDLCRPQGLADQLRAAQVTMFAIGFTLDEKKADQDGTFNTLTRVATGADNCGTVEHPGSFTPADDIDSLLTAFEDLLRPGSKSDPRPVCASVQDATSCGHAFVLDRSITKVHILASSEVRDAQVWVIAPGRPAVELKRGTTAAGASIAYEWLSDQTLTIDLANPTGVDDGWTGQWRLLFVSDQTDSQSSTARISISGNLVPAWPAAASTPLYTGEVVREIEFGLADETGATFDPADLLGTGTLSAELIPQGALGIKVVSDLDVKTLTTAKQSIDLTDVAPGPATLRMTLRLTTARVSTKVPGTALEPAVVDLPVEILTPRGVPPLPKLIDFGTITGPADTTAVLPITGPECVWLSGDAKLAGSPAGVVPRFSAPATGADSCLRVEDSQRGDLRITLTTEDGGNGTLNGTLPISIVPLDAPDQAPTVVDVAFQANLQQPLNPLNTALALIAALVLGPGIPLLLLALFKRVTATIPGETLAAQEVPVQIENGQVLRNGTPLQPRDTDFTHILAMGQSGSRSVQAPGAVLRTRTGLSPFGVGFVEAETPGRVGLSSEHPHPYGKRRAAKLPLAVHNSWIATRGEHDAPGTATVLFLAGIDPTGERRRGLFDDVSARLPGLMAELGDGPTSGGPGGPGGAPDVFGGPAPTGPAPAYDFGAAGAGASQTVLRPPAPPAPTSPSGGWGAGGWTDPFGAPVPPGPTGPAGVNNAPSSQATPPRRRPPAQQPPAQQPPVQQPQQPPSTPASSDPSAGQPWSFDSAFDNDERQS